MNRSVHPLFDFFVTTSGQSLTIVNLGVVLQATVMDVTDNSILCAVRVAMDTGLASFNRHTGVSVVGPNLGILINRACQGGYDEYVTQLRRDLEQARDQLSEDTKAAVDIQLAQWYQVPAKK